MTFVRAELTDEIVLKGYIFRLAQDCQLCNLAVKITVIRAELTDEIILRCASNLQVKLTLIRAELLMRLSYVARPADTTWWTANRALQTAATGVSRS
jgi:hypothetical protein